MKIAVVMGGISPERNISLFGGKAIYNALIRKGHEVIAVDPAKGVNGVFDVNSLEISNSPISKEELSKYNRRELINCINSNIFDGVDCVFLLLHGENGEDGLVQSLLELRGIPYTGSGVKSSSLSMDKMTSKMLFAQAGVPTPPWSILDKESIGDLDLLESVRRELGRAIVVKPINQGSAVGVTVIQDGNLDDLSEAIKLASEFSHEVLLESYIPGREITVAILEHEALPVIEIKPDEGYYDFIHKYTKGKTEYICPADLEDHVFAFSQSISLDAAAACGTSDYCRVDLRVTPEGQIFCLEVNTTTGFTELSLFPMAAKQNGIEFDDLCEKLIELGIESSKRGK